MEREPLGGASAPEGLSEGLAHKCAGVPLHEGPGDDLAGEEVDHDAQKRPAPIGPYVREVAAPYAVGFVHAEVPVDAVKAFAFVVGLGLRGLGLRRGRPWKIHALHEAVHPSNACPYAIFALEQMLRLVHPHPLGVRAVEPEHEPHYGSVLDRPWRLLPVEVLVVCGSAHTKDPA